MIRRPQRSTHLPDTSLFRLIPGHGASVVHEEGVELRTRERQGARLRAADEGDVGRVIVDDVVVVDVVAADRGVFINAPTGRIHDDVVAHGRVIIRRQAAFGGDQNAIDPAVGHGVVGDDFTGRAVVQVNAGGGRAGHDIVHDDAIRPAEVDAVNEIGAAQGADVVDHVADDLNARPVVVATVPDNARGAAAGGGQVMHAGADHLAVIAVGDDAFGPHAADIEVDDLDVIVVLKD